MDIQALQDFLLWSLLINIAIMLLWLFLFKGAGDFMYRVHSYFFPVTREQFSVGHYMAMMLYECAVIVFNFAPLLALYIIF